MSYLKGKDLIYKGHTLECWDNSIPRTIIYKTDKVEFLEAKDFNVDICNCKKPKEFDKF